MSAGARHLAARSSVRPRLTVSITMFFEGPRVATDQAVAKAIAVQLLCAELSEASQESSN
jgi:hypothetical protein